MPIDDEKTPNVSREQMIKEARASGQAEPLFSRSFLKTVLICFNLAIIGAIAVLFIISLFIGFNEVLAQDPTAIYNLSNISAYVSVLFLFIGGSGYIVGSRSEAMKRVVKSGALDKGLTAPALIGLRAAYQEFPITPVLTLSISLVAFFIGILLMLFSLLNFFF